MIWILLILLVLYLLALRGRTDNPGMEELRRWNYAHRGLHGGSLPENSMAAFRAALDGGYGIELDLHLTKDGNLAVIHDSLLKRTTGAEGRIEDLTTADLKNYHLEGTAETIPTFREVLELFGGKAPMIVELKPVGGNHAALAAEACRQLASYSGAYCIESFDPRCLFWLKKHRPQIIRGQLSMNFFRNPEGQPFPIQVLLTCHLLNFLSRPDFIAYKFADRNRLGCFLCRRLWHIQGVSWTLRTPEDHAQARKEGWLSIFEGFRP